MAAGSVRHQGRYTLATRAISDLRGWLARALTKPEIPHATNSPPLGDWNCHWPRGGAYPRAIIAGESGPRGGRRRTQRRLHRAAFNLGRLVGGGALDENNASELIRTERAKRDRHPRHGSGQ